MAILALLTIACIVQLAFAYTIKKVTIKGVEYSQFIPESTEPNAFRGDLFLPTKPPYEFMRLWLKAGDAPRTFEIGAVPVKVAGSTHTMILAKVFSVTAMNKVGIYTATAPELLEWLKENDKMDSLPVPIFDPFAYTFDLDPIPPKIAPAEPGHCYMNAAIVVAENVVGISKTKWNGERWNKKTWLGMAKQLATVTGKEYYGDGWKLEFVQLMLRTQGLNFGLNPYPRSVTSKFDDKNELKYEFQRNNFKKKFETFKGHDFRSVSYYTEVLKKNVEFRSIEKDYKTKAPMAAIIFAVSTIPDITEKAAYKKGYSWPKVNHATVMLAYPVVDGHWWYLDTNQQGILPLKDGKPDHKYVTGKDAKQFFTNAGTQLAKLKKRKYLVEQSASLGGDGTVVAKWLHSKCEKQTVHGECGSLWYYVVVKDPKSKIDDWDAFVSSQMPIQPYLPRDSPWNVAAPFIMLFGTIEVLIFCTCCVVGAVVGYLIHFVKEKYVFSK